MPKGNANSPIWHFFLGEASGGSEESDVYAGLTSVRIFSNLRWQAALEITYFF